MNELQDEDWILTDMELPPINEEVLLTVINNPDSKEHIVVTGKLIKVDDLGFFLINEDGGLPVDMKYVLAWRLKPNPWVNK